MVRHSLFSLSLTLNVEMEVVPFRHCWVLQCTLASSGMLLEYAIQQALHVANPHFATLTKQLAHGLVNGPLFQMTLRPLSTGFSCWLCLLFCSQPEGY